MSTTAHTIAVGQRYAAANGHVLTVTRIDSKADGTIVRVICRNETDGYVGHHGEFVEQVAAGTIVLLESTPATRSLPRNVLPMAEGLAALEAITAGQDRRDAERQAAKVANVMSDWRGKEIVLASGRVATVDECHNGNVRLISNVGTPAAEAAWYPAEEIWRGLEFGSILTPNQIAAGQASLEAITAAQCDGGSWCRCRTADGRLLPFSDALKPHARTESAAPGERA